MPKADATPEQTAERKRWIAALRSGRFPSFARIDLTENEYRLWFELLGSRLNFPEIADHFEKLWGLDS